MPAPFIALFEVAQSTSQLSTRKNMMLAFCSLLARRLKWKDPTPPTHSHWIRKIMYYIKLEKIKYTIRGSTRKCHHNIWQPFLCVEDVEAEADNSIVSLFL